ncbi:MAG: thioredoxin domain-containing protein [Proteobacteria bacterium]|nr:thioredoxin domain-containing protein [Pseudomonadota bacterium]
MTGFSLSRGTLALVLSAALGGGVAGALVAGWRSDALVHRYLLAHPEVLREAAEALRQNEMAEALAPLRAEIERPFAGAVLGNPQGRHVLVEFTDYACTYCRRSIADVKALVAKDPQLKVVIRELPILSPDSAEAAKMALAAARQGHYAAFHQALFSTDGPSPANIAAAARAAGLDLARAAQDRADPAIEAEIENNLALARKLGFTGTPGWLAGDRVLTGAVGAEALAEALKGKS